MTSEDEKFQAHRDAYNERFKPTDQEGEPTGEVVIKSETVPEGFHYPDSRKVAEAAEGTGGRFFYSGPPEGEARALREFLAKAVKRNEDREQRIKDEKAMCATYGHKWDASDLTCIRCGVGGVIVSEEQALKLAKYEQYTK